MRRQFSPYDRVSCCASRRAPTFIVARGSARSRFRSGFLPARDHLMARRNGEKSRSTRTSPRQQRIPVLYSLRKPASEDTIAIKSPVLSRAGFSSRMSGELLQADGTL